MQRGERYDAVVVLQPTSPLRTAEDIRAAWRLFVTQQPCGVASVSPVAPRSWLGQLDASGCFARWQGEQCVYRLNGAIYMHRWAEVLSGAPPVRTVGYVMPPERGVDVDTAQDLDYAEFLMGRREPVDAGIGAAPLVGLQNVAGRT
jgi:CMP-N,N'-diacetyllegionaminic acid synthase